MDYGATHLTAKKTNIKSLSKQSKFEGSDREVRGRIIKQLVQSTPHRDTPTIQPTPRRDASIIQPTPRRDASIIQPTPRRDASIMRPNTKNILTIQHIKSEFPHKNVEKIVQGLIDEGIIELKNGKISIVN
jgi:hypothetical protein